MISNVQFTVLKECPNTQPGVPRTVCVCMYEWAVCVYVCVRGLVCVTVSGCVCVCVYMWMVECVYVCVMFGVECTEDLATAER